MPVCPSCNDENPQLGAACRRCEGYHYIPESSLEDAKGDPRIGAISAEKYVVLGLINEGGMGAVYRALQMPVEREVAVKVLRTELTDSDQAGDRFIREARAVSKLNHPNIITLYDFGFDSNRHPYMVMEYAPGNSLGQWSQSFDMTLERIVSVTHQILSALSQAHGQGIVHRDLKPDNMIVSASNRKDSVKLLDFGIARLINEGASRALTREGEVFGTPHYMAPEQAQGKKNVGPPADIYAVGIMLYEMLSGECPFDAPTPLAVLFMHINEPLPPLVPRTNIVVPDLLSQILAKATAKSPDDRFQDANEMQIALEDLMTSMTTMSGSAVGIRDWTGEIDTAAFADASGSFNTFGSKNFGTAKTSAIPIGAKQSDGLEEISEVAPVASNKSLWMILGALFLVGIVVVGGIFMIPSGEEIVLDDNPETETSIEPSENKMAIEKAAKEESDAALAKIELEKKLALEKEAEEQEKIKKEALENANIENAAATKDVKRSKNRKKKKKKKVATKKPAKKIEPAEKKATKKKKKDGAMKFKAVGGKNPTKFKAQ